MTRRNQQNTLALMKHNSLYVFIELEKGYMTCDLSDHRPAASVIRSDKL